MPKTRPPGPYPIPGINMETWLVRFDKNGICSSPKTLEVLLDNVSQKKDRPVIFFSHGWNNDFADAVDLYRRFLTELEKVLTAHPVAGPHPIFVGVTWPSIWLPSDDGPQMAADHDDPKATSAKEALLRELINILPAGTDWSRLYALLEAEKLSVDQAKELARLLAPLLKPSGDEGAKEAVASEATIVKAMVEIQHAEAGAPHNDDIDEIGVVDDGVVAGDVAPAGFFDFLDPRPAIRLASLYLMKDRAGKVGSSGVAELLRGLLQRTTAPVHVVGHSFGCKVMLSAAAAEPKPDRKLKSMLLLQPAVSHLSFAATVPGRDGPGGYRHVLERVENPIFSTYTASDFPLHEIYHLALLRDEDLGEAKIAAGSTSAGNPPSPYAALGGFGPRGANQSLIDPIPKPGEDFKYPKEARLVGLDGSAEARIDSHGGVANPYTAWALRKQMTL
jgi:pimeloyl-ACP methyl ester carboxylesterase